MQGRRPKCRHRHGPTEGEEGKADGKDQLTQAAVAAAAARDRCSIAIVNCKWLNKVRGEGFYGAKIVKWLTVTFILLE